MQRDDTDRYRSFLLGHLPQREAEKLEQDVLESDEEFQLVLAAEAELFDEWAEGSLAGEDLVTVGHLVESSPQTRRKAEDSIRWVALIKEYENRRSGWLGRFRRLLLAAAAVAAGLGLIWIQGERSTATVGIVDTRATERSPGHLPGDTRSSLGDAELVRVLVDVSVGERVRLIGLAGDGRRTEIVGDAVVSQFAWGSGLEIPRELLRGLRAIEVLRDEDLVGYAEMAPAPDP